MAGKLTDTKIKKLTFKDGPTHGDGNRLYLKVTPNNTKSWVYQYKLNKKRHTMGLGAYPDVSLKQAREKAFKFNSILANNEDPKIHRELTKTKDERLFMNIAFKAIDKLDIGEDSKKRKLRILDKDIKLVFGSRYIDTIKTFELAKFVEKFEKTPSAQRKKKDLLSNIWQYAVAKGFVEHNIVKDISGVLSRERGDNYAYIDPIKQKGWFSQLLKDFDNYPGDIITKAALQILPYLAFRPGIVLNLEWKEIKDNEHGKHLVIPAAKMKGSQHDKRKGPDFIQPLSNQAYKILVDLKEKFYKGDGYIFSINGKKPITHNALRQGLQNTLGYNGLDKKPKQTAHGFRHIFTTGVEHLAGKYGWRELATEYCLAHVSSNKVKNAYNGYEYMDERIVIMQTWADYIDHIKENANVIKMQDIG